MLRLTQRQIKIISMLPEIVCAADIGCDHGRLGAYLIQSGRARRVIATDISVNSLNKARVLAHRLKIEDKMQFRVGDGLKPILNDEAQAVIIAGMSGLTIAHIMEDSLSEKTVFILQPMSEAYKLRVWLGRMGFEIENEEVASERKGRERFYEIIRCRRAGRPANTEERFLYIPKAALLRKDAEMKPFLEYRAAAAEKALNDIRAAGVVKEGKASIEKQLGYYREALSWLK